jgi:hypothetical protein
MDPGDVVNESPERENALAALNATLAREGFEAFYAEDKNCYLRHIVSNAIAMSSPEGAVREEADHVDGDFSF